MELIRKIFALPIYALALLICLLVAWVFAPSITFPFLYWDDSINVFTNTRLLESNPSDLSSIQWIFEYGYISVWRPVNWMGYLLLYWLFGVEPKPFHLASVYLHAINAALLFLISWRICLRLGWERTIAIATASIVSLLWALHPQRAEAVSWISALAYPQGVFLFLLGTHTMVSGMESSGSRWIGWMGVSWLAVTAAILCHPTLMGAPFVLITLSGICFFSGKRKDLPTLAEFFSAKRLLFYGSLFLGSLTVFVMMKLGAPIAQLYQDDLAGFQPQQFLVAASEALLNPWKVTDLAQHYLPASAENFSLTTAFIILGFSLILLWKFPFQTVFASILIVLFLTTMLPVIGFPPRAPVLYDRYFYFPSLVYIFSAIIGLSYITQKHLSSRVKEKMAVITLLVFVVTAIVLGRLSYKQQFHWQDTGAVATRILQMSPSSPKGPLYTMRAEHFIRNGQAERAEADFRASLAHNHEPVRNLAGLALAHFAQSENELAQSALKSAYRLDPNNQIVKGIASLYGVDLTHQNSD